MATRKTLPITDPLYVMAYNVMRKAGYNVSTKKNTFTQVHCLPAKFAFQDNGFTETFIQDDMGQRMRVVYFLPGQCLQAHYHTVVDEQFVITGGSVDVRVGTIASAVAAAIATDMHAGDTINVAANQWHSLTACALTGVIFHETVDSAQRTTHWV